MLRLKELAKILETTGDALLGIEIHAKSRFEEMQEKYGTERLVAYMDAIDKLTGDEQWNPASSPQAVGTAAWW